jgi:signal transduction histidine kinase
MSVNPVGIGVVTASIAGGIGALYLLQYLNRHRGKSGAAWFMGNIAAVVACCLSYGLALLVFDPTLRVGLEMVSFVSVCFMGPFFLAFGLDYTGRADLIRTPFFGVVGVVPIVTTGLVLSNPLHGAVWTGFQFDPLFGLATATYTIQPWGVFALLFSLGTAAVGSLLLIGAIISYGSLYRREATAVVLSTAPPTAGVLLWVLDVGPVPQLHLTAPLMVVHVSLDLYAFVGTHMFETNPATQRAAEQTGLNTLTEPVVIVDSQSQVVNVNERADSLFSHATGGLPVPFETLAGVDLATLREAGEIDVSGSDGGTFAVSYTPLTDPSGDSVGGMIILYDITEERQRKQQLAVLNRVLRHNLRNEMTVIHGFASSIADAAEDSEVQTQAGTIVRASDRLLSIGEQVRRFARLQERSLHAEPVPLDTVIDSLSDQFRTQYPDATVETEVIVSDPHVYVQPPLLELALSNLLENALTHATAETPVVEITVESSGSDEGGMVVTIRDGNDPIPDSEISVLREGTETPLEHGRGIGLWMVNWSLTAMNADVRYRYDEGNVFEMSLPTN